MEKHKNLSVFVPHAGCPNQCSFCDQRSISGAENPPTASEVKQLCNTFLPKDKEGGQYYEIAFFGGSFTAIDREYMLSLLQAAYPFVKEGRAKGIRVSTRPDAISKDILNILKKYGVTAIELGAQSMQEDVLQLNHRGHTQQDVNNAAMLIKEYGFSLGLQMMTGLYGQKNYMEYALDTANKFVLLKPDTVRIYPTVILKGTLLEKLYNAGKYIPPTLEETVEICGKLLEIFNQNNIKIIKLGLHSDQNMQDKIVAGAYHPALRELCLSQLFFNKIKRELTNNIPCGCIIKVNPKQLSQFKGQKNINTEKLRAIGVAAEFVTDSNIEADNLKIEIKTTSEE